MGIATVFGGANEPVPCVVIATPTPRATNSRAKNGSGTCWEIFGTNPAAAHNWKVVLRKTEPANSGVVTKPSLDKSAKSTISESAKG